MIIRDADEIMPPKGGEGTIKLSEAMRKGAKIRPQTRNHYYAMGDDGRWCSCAMGAAIEGALGNMELITRHGAEVLFGGVLGDFVTAPDVRISDSDEKIKLMKAVLCLNDDLEWTRERIADWLEGIGY